MELPHTLPPHLFQQGRTRFCQWWTAKALGMTVGMTAFFVVYFWILRHPLRPVTIMPLTAIDRLIGFQPSALPCYLSLWFYVTLPPMLMVDRRELLSYAVASVVLSAIGLGIFLVWPTAVPSPDIDWSLYPQFAHLKSADASGNACPSLHVAFAVFTAAWFERILLQLGAGRILRALNWLWCTGIMYSTVAVCQHVVLDVIAGTALGSLVAVIHLRWVRHHG